MNPLLKKLLSRYMAPAGDDGSDTGGTDVIDRGDSFTPTEDEPAAKPAPAPKAADPDDDIDPDDPDADPDAKEETKAEKQREQRIPPQVAPAYVMCMVPVPF